MAAKIHYGICHVYYSVLTETLGTNGQYTESYGSPKQLIGARSISLSPTQENVNFAADNNANYFTQNIFSGYEGTLVLATLDDNFRKDVYGEKADTNNLVGESINDTPKKFALLFQFETDDKAVRHVMYRCSAGKYEIASTTKDQTIEPGEISIPITVGSRLSDGLVKWKCDGNVTTQYNAWFSSVYVPTFSG